VLQQSDQGVDVVFSDVEMRGAMDGFGLNRWIRENCPDVPVILAGTPARASVAAADLCKEGPDLAKPYEPQLVLDRIRRLLGNNGRLTRKGPEASFVPKIRSTSELTA
jgi:DNA-binding NtrC family response regulator